MSLPAEEVDARTKSCMVMYCRWPLQAPSVVCNKCFQWRIVVVCMTHRDIYMWVGRQKNIRNWISFHSPLCHPYPYGRQTCHKFFEFEGSPERSVDCYCLSGISWKSGSTTYIIISNLSNTQSLTGVVAIMVAECLIWFLLWFMWPNVCIICTFYQTEKHPLQNYRP